MLAVLAPSIALLSACAPPADPPLAAPPPAVPAPLAPSAPPASAAPDRWAEVVALAGADPCVPAPTALAEALARDPRDPEEIRVHLGAWHAAQPDVFVRFAGPAPVAGMNGVLAWSDWILDGELPAWIHLLASLDRCGGAELAGLAAAHAEHLCTARGEVFARAAADGLRLSPLPSVAAREAVTQVAALDALSAGGGRGAAEAIDLRRYLEGWILDGGAGALPPVERGTRPLAAMTRAAMEGSWSTVTAKRASAERCLGAILPREHR